MTVYVRRYQGPMSPANTAPRFTPIRIGIARSPSAIWRSASSIRSSSLPVIVGAPAVRISLPPSSSASVERKQHPVLVARRLGVGQQLLELVGDRRGPALLDHPVGPVEVDERDRDLPVLGVPPPASTCVAHRRRQAVRDRVRIDAYVRDLGATWWPGGSRFRRNPGPFALAEAARRHGGGDLRAHEDLPRLGDVLHPDRPGPAGPGHDQLSMGPADVEEVIRARVHADRHPQLDVRAGHLDPADLTERAPHPHGRRQRVRDVVLFLEQQQQRVAAELDAGSRRWRRRPTAGR